MSERKHEAIEQAARWIEKIERTLEPHESKALRDWLQDPLHREVIVDRCRLWHGPEILGLLGQLIHIEPPRSRTPPREGKIVVGIFVAVWGLSIAAFLFAQVDKSSAQRERGPLRAEIVYRTAAGERRSAMLPDGSRLAINAETHLLVSFGVRSRDITLVRGEVLFDIVPDAERPLRLSASGRRFEVVAIGSQFSVRRLSNAEVELLVTDGQVHALSSRSTRPLTPAEIRARLTRAEHMFTAREAAVLGPGWNMLWQLEPAELRERLAWSRDVID